MALGSFKPLDNVPGNSLARLHRRGRGGGLREWYVDMLLSLLKH